MSGIGDAFKRWGNAALHFAYPEVCQLCRSQRATAAEGFVCRRCWLQVHFIRRPFCERCGLPFEGDFTTKFECTNCRAMELHFVSARSAVVARGVVLEAIHRFKYNGADWFGPFLADLLLREAAPELQAGKWNFIVPVPLHPLKLRDRGFNQAAHFAAALGERIGIPVNDQLLARRRPTRTQTLLTREERAENVHRAFAVAGGTKLGGERIVLVDDVFTTGATTSACAATLRAAGAGAVCVWTVARGL